MLSSALLATTTKSSGSDELEIFLLIIVVYGAFWYFFMRPRMRRARAARSGGSKFEVGDKIQTIGGLVATVTSIEDRTVVVRTTDGTELEFVKAAISQKFLVPSEVPEPPDGDTAHSDDETH